MAGTSVSATTAQPRLQTASHLQLKAVSVYYILCLGPNIVIFFLLFSGSDLVSQKTLGYMRDMSIVKDTQGQVHEEETNHLVLNNFFQMPDFVDV